MDANVHKFIVEMGRAVTLAGAALRELAKATQPETGCGNAHEVSVPSSRMVATASPRPSHPAPP